MKMYLGLVLVSVATLLYGEVPLNIVLSGLEWNPLLQERIPRLIVLLFSGASLAVSGAVMQALFNNPLASPSVLGITAGGSLCATMLFASGLYIYPLTIPVGTFLGCLATLFLIYTMSRSMHQLILSGIALSTIFFALQGAIVYALRHDWQLINLIAEWDAGSTFDRSWKHVHMQLPLTIVGLVGCVYYSKTLNLLSLGEEEALSLGVDVPKVRFRLFLFVALLVGGTLASVGIIAFFGLLSPHLLRLISGANNAKLIPLCVVGGACSLAALDLLLRVLDLHTLALGNVSAVLGGIFFSIFAF